MGLSVAWTRGRPFVPSQPASMSGVTRFAGTTGHPKGEVKTGLAAGVDKGKALTKFALKAKPSHRKGKLNKRVAFVREVISEVAGFSPYEKRVMELLKVGKEKRALKVLKHRLGTHKRAKSKREEMQGALRELRMG